MFEVPLGCTNFGLYADYKVNTIPFGSPAYTDGKNYMASKFKDWFLVQRNLSYPVQCYCVLVLVFLNK
jgi:hypothetical protein